MANGFPSLTEQTWEARIVGALLFLLIGICGFMFNAVVQVKTDVAVIKDGMVARDKRTDSIDSRQQELAKRSDEQDRRMDSVENKADAAFAGQCAECAQQEAERARRGTR